MYSIVSLHRASEPNPDHNYPIPNVNWVQNSFSPKALQEFVTSSKKSLDYFAILKISEIKDRTCIFFKFQIEIERNVWAGCYISGL
jgi:hypothetical protein